jgi:HEAT repeat protein
MNPLQLIWDSATLLAAGALVWMLWLVGARQFVAAEDARRARDLAMLRRCLVGLLRHDPEAFRSLRAYRGRTRLLAEALIEFAGLVRGADRANLVDKLIDADVERALVRRAQHRGKPGRLAAIEALGLFPPVPGRNILTRATRDPDPDIRFAAWRSIRECGGEIRLRDLLDTGEYDHAHPRLTFMELFRDLAAARPDEAAELLLARALPAALENEVVEALAESGAVVAAPALAQVAAGGHGHVRAAALRALGRLRVRPPLSVIAEALGDGEWEVRGEAAATVARCELSEQTEEVALLLSDENWWVRHQAAEALTHLGPAGRRRLERALHGGEDRARRAASWVLTEQRARAA